MKRLAAAVFFSVAAAGPAFGQAFTNLGFEAAVVVPADPMFGWLDWGLAVPGWGHSPGSDTGVVYHGLTHVGVTQWFRLVDASQTGGQTGGLPGSPLQGQYAMQFASGHVSGDPASPWVPAYLSQTGLVPAEAMSLTFLASRAIEVTAGGASLAPLSLGGQAYAVDVSAYAGTVVELRFINPTLQLHDPVTLDGLAFSTTPVPEPATWLLFGLGAALLPGLRRARRG